jgi:hypothetical protein
MKKTIFIVSLVVLVCIGLVFARNIFFKTSVEDKIKSLIGLPVKADCVEAGYFIRIKGLKVSNPEGFSSAPIMDISSIKLDKNLGLMQVWVKELHIEKSPTGRINTQYLRPATTGLPDLKIKSLKLHVAKVSYYDQTTGKKKEYEVVINKQYDNITDPSVVPAVIIAETVKDNPNPPIEGDIIPPDPPVDDIIDDGTIIPPEPPGDGDGDQPSDDPESDYTGRC